MFIYSNQQIYNYPTMKKPKQQITNAREQLQSNVDIKDLKILKFRSFASKQQQGFVFIFDHQLSEIIFEDLLFQLFEPLFEDLQCPQIYYFSSTDQNLSYAEMIKMKDYVYVHLTQRIRHYQTLEKYPKKLKIGDIEKLSKGVHFQSSNLYIISEKYYLMYKHQFFYKNVQKKIQDLPLQVQRKQIKYEQYCKQIANLRSNQDFIQRKDQIQITMQGVSNNLKKLETITYRYGALRKTLQNILKQSGIKIQGVKDLY